MFKWKKTLKAFGVFMIGGGPLFLVYSFSNNPKILASPFYFISVGIAVFWMMAFLFNNISELS